MVLRELINRKFEIRKGFLEEVTLQLKREE